MNTLQNIKETLGSSAKDIKLNLGMVLSEEGAPGLSQTQIWGVALASAYATQNAQIASAFVAEARTNLAAEQLEAAKAAANIMAMNNVYYRFAHSAQGNWLQKPANLRMNIMANPGVPAVDFELYSLAVSAINGCGLCMDSHTKKVLKQGVTEEGVQSAIRVAAVVQAVAQSLFSEQVA